MSLPTMLFFSHGFESDLPLLIGGDADVFSAVYCH